MGFGAADMRSTDSTVVRQSPITGTKLERNPSACSLRPAACKADVTRPRLGVLEDNAHAHQTGAKAAHACAVKTLSPCATSQYD